MKSDNLVEITNALVGYGVSVALFVAMNLYKHVITEEYVTQGVPSSNPRRQQQLAENGWAYKFTWIATCVLIPIFSNVLFVEVYSEPGGVADSTVSILALVWSFMGTMMLWIYVQYIARFHSKVVIVFMFILMFAVYLALVGFVFGSLHSMHPGHFIVILLFLPIVSSIIATQKSNNYREAASKNGAIPSSRTHYTNGDTNFSIHPLEE